MQITSITLEKHEGYQRLVARIDKFDVWFRFPSFVEVDAQDATPFVILCLVPAMLHQRDIRVAPGYRVSPRLLRQVPAIQRIYNTWNPVFRPIAIDATAGEPAERRALCASFFSGGVDGTYTLLTHRDEIDYLVLLNGFDQKMRQQPWRAMVQRNTELAEHYGKTLVPVETNHQSFISAINLAGFANFGGTLAAIGQILGSTRVLISGADTYAKLEAEGAHPLLDPLYSTERTEVVHTGLEADRYKKLALIKQHEYALNRLWVCWAEPGVNCGRCSKCIRTFIALQLHDVEQFNFVHQPQYSDIASIDILSSTQLGFLDHFVDIARAKGKTEIVRVLGRRLVRFRIKFLLKEILRTYFPMLYARQQRRRPAGDEHVMVSVFPRYSDETAREYGRRRIDNPAFVQEEYDLGSCFF